MITIYTSPSCASCRKVKKWFKDQNIPFIEKNIFSSTLDEKELKEILRKSENGTSDIISTRSNVVKVGDVNVEDLSINQLIQFIKEHPSILKRPIIVDDRRIQVGYNEEEIRVFIPMARRIAEAACKYHLDCCCCNCECEEDEETCYKNQ